MTIRRDYETFVFTCDAYGCQRTEHFQPFTGELPESLAGRTSFRIALEMAKAVGWKAEYEGTPEDGGWNNYCPSCDRQGRKFR